MIAAGIAEFASKPSYAAGLPAELASHTGEHADLGRFAGSKVLVVGGGQSALESAALLRENGAQPQVAVRKDHLNWLHGGRYHRKLGRLAPLVYAPTDVGPMGLSRIVARPDLFRRLPRRLQEPMAYRAIRPAGPLWLADRLQDVPVAMSRAVAAAVPASQGLRVSFTDGSAGTFDHLLLGTGYKVDITQYSFLAPSLVARIRRAGGYPVLGRAWSPRCPVCSSWAHPPPGASARSCGLWPAAGSAGSRWRTPSAAAPPRLATAP